MWLVALIQNPQAAPPGGLRLDGLVILLWPVTARSEELAVALSTTPNSTSANAWPARPFPALPRQIRGSKSTRAFRNVPSGAGVCADHIPL